MYHDGHVEFCSEGLEALHFRPVCLYDILQFADSYGTIADCLRETDCGIRFSNFN